MQIDIILNFLKELSANNNREWFAANREQYDSARRIFEEISNKLIAGIGSFDKSIIQVEAKDCIFRIYRDIRFSHDKTPYKTHFGVYIAAHGGRKSPFGGYYLHLEPTGCFLGAGVWQPPPPTLKALRQAVYDNIDELNEIRAEKNFKRYFPAFFEEDKLKSVPAGFPKDFPDADLLKLKHYLVEYKIDDALLKSEKFCEQAIEIFRVAEPFNKFLNYTIEEAGA
ncbi:MAG: DUF2461 domain-containing protein [Paludibacter sp.]|jgi:uncharacterized protein (TIGR02453 family)|nr:DUF2461 domain-containing protein [Paludibacter sp.]